MNFFSFFGSKKKPAGNLFYITKKYQFWKMLCKISQVFDDFFNFSKVANDDPIGGKQQNPKRKSNFLTSSFFRKKMI